MRVETKNVYEFEELNTEAQQFAVNDYISTMHYISSEQEIIKSYDLATELIYDQLENLREISSEYEMEFEQEFIYGIRLYKWIINNLSYVWTENKSYVRLNKDSRLLTQYPKGLYSTYSKYTDKNEIKRQSKIHRYNNLENCGLTGYTFDFEAMQNIIDFVKNPDENTTIYELVNNRKELQTILDENYEAETSFEQVKENIICNEYEFYENGIMI